MTVMQIRNTNREHVPPLPHFVIVIFWFIFKWYSMHAYTKLLINSSTSNKSTVHIKEFI